MTERLLTVKQVAERYGLSEDFVYGCKGLKPYRKYQGRKIFFSLADLEKFEASRSKTRGYDISPKMQALIRQRSLEARNRRIKERFKFDFK